MVGPRTTHFPFSQVGFGALHGHSLLPALPAFPALPALPAAPAWFATPPLAADPPLAPPASDPAVAAAPPRELPPLP
jgi:hypothetical protein